MAGTAKIRSWLALLGSPLLALTNLSFSYALATPSCEAQNIVILHSVSILSLLLSLLFTFIAWQTWRQHHQPNPEFEDDEGVQRSFLPAVAAMTGLFFTLVIAAQWLPQWILSPCYA
ncbi:MAG TPA: hypothetical protein VEA39_05930 [Methylophilaceae bacterium]|nr:hypothetical protein [Methylophilaceae bacterium]